MAIAAVLVPSSFAQKLVVDLVSADALEKRLESGLVKNRDRQEAIRGLFESVGCTPTEQAVTKHAGNVICTLPGATGSTITVGGHFDFADEGKGIVDDWSGASLLPSLYQSLKSVGRKHTFVFVAFAKEEDGLVGSSRYVKELGAAKPSLRAFVNLECLGVAPAKVWLHRSSPALVAPLTEVADALGIPLRAVNVEKIGDDDTHPFLNAGFPVICIHSLTQENFRVIHSPADRLQAIHFDDYSSAYKLVAYYLAYLDQKLE